MSLPIFAIRTQFDPRRLPSLELWYRAGDTSRNWTTTAATTSVTADTDPVGRVDSPGSTNYLEQATAIARPQWRTAQRRGIPAWSFDGSDDRLQTVNNITTAVTGDPSFTLAMWLYIPSAATENRAFCGWGDVNTALSAAGLWFGNRVTGVVAFEFAGNNAAWGNTTITRDTWTHVAVTKRPGTIKSTTTIFINGVSETNNASSSNNTPTIAVGNKFSLGQWANYNTDRLQCFLDQVVLYSRELAATEVRYLAQGT